MDVNSQELKNILKKNFKSNINSDKIYKVIDTFIHESQLDEDDGRKTENTFYICNIKCEYNYTKDIYSFLSIDDKDMCFDGNRIDYCNFNNKFLKKLDSNLKKNYGISNKLFFKIIKRICINLNEGYDICDEMWEHIEKNT